ncbi:DUF2381 family protein [Archangium gephyra]|uniref:DUF2381 family protein n=1 Tax=Archangium gephyra TaxID=48 RepID=UPI0035D45505
MRALPPTALLLLVAASAQALARPFTEEMTGGPRFTVTADTASESRQVRISPGVGTLFVFDTPVQREGVFLEQRERFRQVSLSEDGHLLTLLPLGELSMGTRLRLTVRFADGEVPASVGFLLVVHPQAEHQVEVFRLPRSADSYKQEFEAVQVEAQQCKTQLARERAECGRPSGLSGPIVSHQLDWHGIRARRFEEGLPLRRGEAFRSVGVTSYSATNGNPGEEVVRLAVELELANHGLQPWRAANAELVGPGGRWTMALWAPEPIPPGKWGHIVVEMELPLSEVRSGSHVLKLWDEAGVRTATLLGVTFPE